MRSRLGQILFIVLAPLSVPVYLILLAGANMLGAAFYIVFEASITPLVRRPVSLSPAAMIILAVPVLLLAPAFAAVHLALWFIKLTWRGLVWLGHWQTGARSKAAGAICGFIWAVVAMWCVVSCLNAAFGAACIGRPVRGKEAFVETVQRMRTMGELPAEMQQRRAEVIARIKEVGPTFDSHWQTLVENLQDNGVLFSGILRHEPLVAHRIAGIPWFFQAAELSEDGMEHSILLLGPLFFVALLLVRWPGMFAIARSSAFRGILYVLRIGVAAGTIFYLLTWNPATSFAGFSISSSGPSQLFSLLCPAYWMGCDFERWVRPEWYLLNAALWMSLIGLASALWWMAWRITPLLGWPRYYVAFLASRLLQRKQIAFFSVAAVTLCVAMMIIVISVMSGFVDSIRTRAHGLLGDLVIDGSLQGIPYYQPFIDRLAKLNDPKTGKPLLVQATPLIHTYGILQFRSTHKTKAVNVWGIRLKEFVRVNEFGKDLYYQNRYGTTTLGKTRQPVWAYNKSGIATLPGDMDKKYGEYVRNLPPEERRKELQKYHRELGDRYNGPGVITGPAEKPEFIGDELPGAIIGRPIITIGRTSSGEYIRDDDCPLGEPCFITVLPVTRSGDVSAEPPPKPRFRYIDDSRTGIHEIDSMNVYVDFEELQRLLSMGSAKRHDAAGEASARCSQIQIKLTRKIGDDRRGLEEIKELVRAEWRKFRDEIAPDPLEYDMMMHVHVSTWEEMQENFISAVEKEKFLVLIMFGVISTVAVFLILCIFYMIVQEKTRDIGIIKSIGGSAEGVAAVFLTYGGAIGIVGCVLGSLLGTTFVQHINDIQDWLARLNPDWRVWSPETYSFDRIPDVWKWGEVLWICVLAIVASIAGAALPASRAGRTWPVESLRYE